MHAAGIVADHPAQIAVFMRGRIRAKGEIEFVGAIAQLIQHAAGLHPCIFLLRIDFDDLVQVLGEINDHGDVAGLSAKAGAAAARQQRSVVLAGQSHGLDYFFNCFGNYNADWNLTIIGSIHGIESAGAIVKPHFACDGGAQLGGKGLRFVAGLSAAPVLDS